MKKLIITMLVAVFALSLYANDGVPVIRGKFGDTGNGVTQSFENEIFEGEIALKITWAPDTAGSVGAIPPLVANWSSFNTLVFEVYNPSEKMLSFNMVVRTGTSKAEEERSENTAFAVRPGKRTVKISLSDITSGATGELMRLENVRHFYFFPANKSSEQEIVLYVKSIMLQ